MIGALVEFKDKLLGRGAASITVPVFDGALKSNRIVEDAEVVASFEAAEDIASDGHSLFIADGARILRLDPGGTAPVEVKRFAAPISALACLDTGFAVALDGREVVIEGGAHHGRRWDAVSGRPLNAVNAISVGHDGQLLVSDGSREQPVSKWKHDLMGLGRSGRVLELSPADGAARERAGGMAYAFGACAVGGEIWASESWRHRVVRIGDTDRSDVTDALPGYPSRMTKSPAGGVWLTCFALRTQLVEFVLREPRFRKRMIAEIDPAYWIAPALTSGNTFLEPMQGAQLKMMGIVKPWAPPRSYGLVVRLTDAGLVRYSLHSRFDGRHHGIVAAAELGGALYLLSKGRQRLLRLDVASAEKELAA